MSSLFYLNKYLAKYKWRLILGALFILISNIFKAYLPVVVKDSINEIEKILETGATGEVNDLLDTSLATAGLYILVSLISGIYETLVNRAGGAIMQNNLEILGPIEYSKEEIAFAKRIQEVTSKPQDGMDSEIRPLMDTREHPGGGSTDVGDVSWNVANINVGVATAPIGTPWHSWAVVACGGMSIGHKGMLHASKAMAMTMSDLYQNDELVKKVKNEYLERKGNEIYVAMVPEGPPPVNDN